MSAGPAILALTKWPCYQQGPVGVANKHVETAIDDASGKLTMLYQARPFYHLPRTFHV
jgi:hypothetical protein